MSQSQVRTRRPAITEQTEAWVRLIQGRLETFNGDSSERDQGHYDGLIEALALGFQAQVGAS